MQDVEESGDLSKNVSVDPFELEDNLHPLPQVGQDDMSARR